MPQILQIVLNTFFFFFSAEPAKTLQQQLQATLLISSGGLTGKSGSHQVTRSMDHITTTVENFCIMEKYLQSQQVPQHPAAVVLQEGGNLKPPTTASHVKCQPVLYSAVQPIQGL